MSGFDLRSGVGANDLVRPYTGIVATRINIPTLISTGNLFTNSRRWFRARDDITRLQVAFPNWLANNVVNEAGSGGTLQIQGAAIERINGSVQRLKWSGAPQSEVVANGGQTALCDALILETPIKKGEWFAVRANAQWSVAAVLNSLSSSTSISAGDALEFSTTALADKSQSGTIGTQASLSYGPCLIVGTTRQPSAALFGDSRVRGGAASPGVDTADGSGDLGEWARSVGPLMGYINMGTASETLQAFLTNNSRRLALSAYCSHIGCNYGVNDLLANRTAAQLLADIAAFCALPAFAGKRIFWGTINPRTTSTDGWTTLANQTLPAWEAHRLTVNDTLRACRVVGLAGCFDICAATESAINSGRYAIGNGGQAITADGLHLTALGCQEIGASRVIDPRRWL